MAILTFLRTMTLAGILGSMVVVAADAPAHAFLDRLFNPKHYDNDGNRKEAERVEAKRRAAVIKKARISAPRYFTYKPDAFKTVTLGPLATLPKEETAAVSEADPVKLPASGEASDVDTTGTVTESSDAGPVAAVATHAGDVKLNGVPEIAVSPERREAGLREEFDLARVHLKDMRLRTLPQVANAVIAHYKPATGFIWTTDGKVNDRARAVLAAFQGADALGLDPADYQVALPEGDIAAETDGDATGKAAMRFEMEMSAKALLYVLDARRGRVDPNRLSGYHDLPRKKVDLSDVLTELAEAEDAGDYLMARHPSSPEFKALVRSRSELTGADEAERIEIADGTFIKPGRSDPELANVIAGIRLRGSDDLKTAHEETLSSYENGELYTPELVALVKDYQKETKLTVDGIIGKDTIRTLIGDSNAQKIKKLELAMERLRWLPDDLGERRVFVNQPAFKATFSTPGREPLSMRVVVGKRSNQTSFFMDEIETVEFNPYWGVPLSIIVNEMLPKLSKDPSYLDRAGYEVTTVTGRKVSSSSVDWYAVATKSQSINVRQYPGRKNALGELKILFPNKHHIYMHDTPHKRLFKRDSRAFSHGCIRLHQPRAMAAAILGKSTDYVASRISQGKNDADKVNVHTPVYVAYFTAWPDADGTVGFFHDVYGRDKHLQKAMARTDKARG